MEEKDFCGKIQEIQEEYTRCLKPTIDEILGKERKDLTSEDFIILAESTHKLWIISEILKGRTAFLLDDTDVEEDSVAVKTSTALTTMEQLDLYGRKITEARSKLLLNKNN